MRLLPILFLVGLMLSTTACVSKKKHEALANQLEREQARAALQQRRATKQINELMDAKMSREDSITILNARVQRLEKDLADEREAVVALQEDYNNLKSQSGKKILDLISELEVLRQDIYNRELRLNEVQKQLEARNAAADQLRDRIKESLLQFGDALEVDVREGKVYVKLANKLLFASGEATISPDGRNALQSLATVLQRDSTLNVNVEGHTDNKDILSIRCIEDNWQLSVIRSTNVVKALLDAGVSPKRMVASGRSKYLPVAPNTSREGRAKNRRTEIILVPDYSSLLRLLDDNAPYKDND